MALAATDMRYTFGYTPNTGYCIIDKEVAELLKKDAMLITPELDDEPQQETAYSIEEGYQEEWCPENDLYWQLFGVRKYSKAWERDMAVCREHDRLYDECIAKGIDPRTMGL